MTDHSRYKSPSGAQLTLRLRTSDALDLDQRLFLMVDGRGMFIPTAELLAMIDAADPDAMRAYLRETAPEVIADLYRPEAPEADSPEDVDEHPDAGVEGRLYVIERLARVLRDGTDAELVTALADWVLER